MIDDNSYAESPEIVQTVDISLPASKRTWICTRLYQAAVVIWATARHMLRFVPHLFQLYILLHIMYCQMYCL